ncbi:MAG: hypothetical protein ACXWVT_10480, partial [Burkholderiaceae bacterium]
MSTDVPLLEEIDAAAASEEGRCRWDVSHHECRVLSEHGRGRPAKIGGSRSTLLLRLLAPDLMIHVGGDELN